MAQIAQQDHLYIQIQDFTDITDEEKAIIREKIFNGTILDVVLHESSYFYKVLGYFKSNIPGRSWVLFYDYEADEIGRLSV